MTRLITGLGLLASLACCTLAQATDIPTHDVAGSRDHPIISRFTWSVIAGYQASDYGEVVFPMGKPKWSEPDHFSRSRHIEGKVTRVFYIAPAGKTALEVYRNFESGLTQSSFKTTYACAGDSGAHGCGGHDFADYLINPLLDTLHARNLMIEELDVVNGNVRYLSAHLDRPAGDVDISLLVAQDDKNPTGVLLQIVEAKPMASDQVTVDAKAMGDGLAKSGHIALYGIRFASDSSTLAESSNATLEEMAKLLKAHPGLKAFIVGHTDDTGTLSHNMALSQARADAVMTTLVDRYHISAGRLAAKGLASYAPVAGNSDEAGRARNRRVELVEQ